MANKDADTTKMACEIVIKSIKPTYVKSVDHYRTHSIILVHPTVIIVAKQPTQIDAYTLGCYYEPAWYAIHNNAY